MITLRPSAARGHADHGWLDTHHTFSFADYYDPDHMGFRSLRVINEDRVAPGRGFGTHPHRDMEIITYIVDGALEHKDSLGTGAIIRPGDAQRMTAGSGIAHSEFNPSREQPVHLLQIWIEPAVRGLKPSYEQKAFPLAAERNRLHLLATPTGAEGSITIHQNVLVSAGRLDDGAEVAYDLAPGRHAWVQVVRGGVALDGEILAAGDGAAISGETRLALRATGDTELVLFDLA